ncbi:porin family protein [Lacinutrix jangbogonensis]|uniref:porin family protein n=1 Tax=Lacinutrix jangbogonensis TaxID=1469557 RepID=UPI00053DCF2A|nr:porin family protein [Lacinutrix jangbogonensis]
MKKQILLLCVLFAVCFAQAQTDSEKPTDKRVKFGLRIGYEFQVNDSNLEYKPNLPYIGVFSDINLGKKWSFQLELNLRSEKRDRLFNTGFRNSIHELYLTVPIFFKYRFDNKFKAYSGTQVLSASLVNDINGFKKWNGILGAEYHWTKNVILDARFRHGFEGRACNNNFRDNRISVGIGYKF